MYVQIRFYRLRGYGHHSRRQRHRRLCRWYPQRRGALTPKFRTSPLARSLPLIEVSRIPPSPSSKYQYIRLNSNPTYVGSMDPTNTANSRHRARSVVQQRRHRARGGTRLRRRRRRHGVRVQLQREQPVKQHRVLVGAAGVGGDVRHALGVGGSSPYPSRTLGRTDGQTTVPSLPVPSLNSGLPSMPYHRRTAVKTAVPSTGRQKDGRMGRTIMIVFTGASGLDCAPLQFCLRWITVDVPARTH
ncbi:hypothetical protein B0H14DRAFT_2606491 [Mycena olivaceomarginata]|nr:hypothetical protein B0H14DRAFT_2606491 [Mycena olivaceomarginata]